MTYISAFRCLGGIVMSADTQEDWGDQKNYVEKLTIVEEHAYPLAIGGAGIADLIDPMVQEVTERAAEIKPATAKELATLIKEAIVTVYRDDLPWLAVKKHERTPEFLIAAKPTAEDYCIFRIKGKRLYPVKDMAIIGYATPVNSALLKRMYRDNLPMQQAVMLAVYLVSISKKLDSGVGGETRIAVVTENGAWIDDPEYIAEAEKRVEEFLKLTDEMFLTCIDVSIAPSDYIVKNTLLTGRIDALRERYLRDSATRLLTRTHTDPMYPGEPYPKLFGGASITANPDGSVAVREMTQEEQANLFSSAALPGDRFSRINLSRNGYYTIETLFPWSPDKTVRNLTRDEVVNHFTGSEIWGCTIDKILEIVDQAKHFFVNSRNPSEAKDNENEKGRWFLVPTPSTPRT